MTSDATSGTPYWNVLPLPEHAHVATAARQLFRKFYPGVSDDVRVTYVFWKPGELVTVYVGARARKVPFAERFVVIDDDKTVRAVCGHPLGDGMICTLGVCVV